MTSDLSAAEMEREVDARAMVEQAQSLPAPGASAPIATYSVIEAVLEIPKKIEGRAR